MPDLAQEVADQRVALGALTVFQQSSGSATMSLTAGAG
jgi:hypothetical protein